MAGYFNFMCDEFFLGGGGGVVVVEGGFMWNQIHPLMKKLGQFQLMCIYERTAPDSVNVYLIYCINSTVTVLR